MPFGRDVRLHHGVGGGSRRPAHRSWPPPRPRPNVTGIPGKTGVVYALDRETGEIPWATPTVTQNVISNIDGATGIVTENSEVVFTSAGQTLLAMLACPAFVTGGKDWESVYA